MYDNSNIESTLDTFKKEAELFSSSDRLMAAIAEPRAFPRQGGLLVLLQ